MDDLGTGAAGALAVLDRCCLDVARRGRLTRFGQWAFGEFLATTVAQRLTVVDAVSRRPALAGVALPAPLFVVGWYRSGTTFLHHLLARLPWLRALSYWELRHPTASSTGRVAAAKARTGLANGIHRLLSPRFQSVHPVRVGQPEECMHLFDHSLTTPTPAFLTEAQEFLRETTPGEILAAYQFYELQLRILHAAGDGRRLLLKWPYHLFHLDTLLDVFPNARVVWIHRDPAVALPSVCSLTEITRAPFCHEVDRPRLGAFWMERYESALPAALTGRERLGPERLLDLHVDRLARDPLGCVSRLSAWCDHDLDSDQRRRLEAHLASRPLGKSRGHRYSAGTYGLSEAGIRRRFRRYVEVCREVGSRES